MFCVLCLYFSVKVWDFLFSTGRLGKPTYFSAVFNTLSPAIKQSWISNLQMAKLALGTVHDLQILHRIHIMIRKMIVLQQLLLFMVECYLCVASEEDNLQGWFFAEDDGNQIKKQKHPLLLQQMPVVMSKLQEFKVRLRSLH